MTPLSWQDAGDWAQENFGSVDLGDLRRRIRAVELGGALAGAPAGSLPQQCEDAAALKGAYLLLNCPEVSFEALCATHWQNTLKIASDYSLAIALEEKAIALEEQATPNESDNSADSIVTIPNNAVLFVQDATYLDYSAHRACQGLGPIGDGKGRGMVVQSCLALVPPGPRDPLGHILGMAQQSVWARAPLGSVKPLKKLGQRTEQDIWAETLTAMQEVPEGAFYVSVADRNSDVLSYWQRAQARGWHLLSRLYHKRVCYDGAGVKQNLISWGRSLLHQGAGGLMQQSARTILVSMAPNTPRVPVQVRVAYAPLRLVDSRNAKGVSKRLPKSLLPLSDPGQPADEQPADERVALSGYLVHCCDDARRVEWFLFTTVPINTLADAWQIVDWYCRRWCVEEYHKCLKTGCAMEKTQLRDAEAIKALLAFQSLLAVRLLALRDLSRAAPDMPASQVISPQMLEALCLRYRLDAPRLKLSEFWRRAAMLGGFLGRKSDGQPGWQTLWRGWLKLIDYADGITMARQPQTRQPQKCG